MKPILPQVKGWALFGLIVVTIAYSAWYASPGGAYGQLSGMAPNMPLQGQVVGYEAQTALDAYGQIRADGKAGYVYHALLLDIPYMILNCLTFAGLMGFGLQQLNIASSPARHVLWLPSLALLIDAIEDTALATLMARPSDTIAALAGPLTAMKFIIWIPTTLLAIGLALIGLIFWGYRRLRKS